MSIHTDAQAAFTEHFENVLNSEGVLIEDADITYWQDDVSEIADGLVPVYTSEIVREWTEAGYPEVDDSGLIEGVTDIIKIMAIALYELYSQELYQLADDAGFND